MSALPTSLDRTLAAFRALVRSVYPALRYFGRYRYSVHSATATTFDGIPVDATVAPALPTGVPYAPALAGSSCIPTQGTIAHVMFADGDPGQPWCVGFESGGASSATTIDAGAVNLGDAYKPPVRETDTYTATGVVPGTITLTLLSTLDPNGPTKVKV